LNALYSASNLKENSLNKPITEAAMKQRNFVVFTASAFLFLIVFFAPSLIASQENSNKPSIKRSIPQSEISNPPSVKSNPSNPQSAIQNLSSTSIGEPKFEKSELIQKTKKIQMPFIANNGQADEKVKFYANTFGGTVFVTKDGEIVYSLPGNSSGLGVRGSANQDARCMIRDPRNMSNITRLSENAAFRLSSFGSKK